MTLHLKVIITLALHTIGHWLRIGKNKAGIVWVYQKQKRVI